MGYDEKKEKDMAEIRENFKRIQAITEKNAKFIENTRAITEKNAEAIAESVRNTEEWKQESQNRLNKLEGDEGNRLGDIVETIARENIARLLQDYGIEVNHVHGNTKDTKYHKWEIDAVAVNGEEVVIVETKATLTCGDVHAFIEKSLKNVRTYLSSIGDKKVYGAIAYFRAKNSNKYGNPVKNALKEGLFVISVVGDTAEMLNDKSFKPKAF